VVQRCCGMTEMPVYLYVFQKNEGAVRLYRRLGFEIIQTVGNSRYIMQRA
jgi:ribosomal protein S18 acetylase RimI-like enzyme